MPVVDAAEHADLEPSLLDGTLVEDAKGVRFADPNVMIQGAAENILATEEALLVSSPRACFNRLNEIWAKEIGKENTVSGNVLAALHNSHRIDAFNWAREAVEAGVGNFDALHVMKGSLPHFEHAEAASIFRFLAESYEAEKNDIFGGALYPKLECWLPKHPEIAREIKRLHEAQPEARSYGLYGAAVHALIHHDFRSGFALALAATGSPERFVAGSALNVLGLVDYAHPDRHYAIDETLRVCARIVGTPEHPLLRMATETVSRMINLREFEVTALLEKAAMTRNSEALYAISDFLFREQKDYWDQPWFWPLVMLLTAVDPANSGTMRNVDHLMYGWLKDPARVSKVLEFLNAWIAAQSEDALQKTGFVKSFESTVHRLAEVPSALGIALTNWLLNPEDRYPLVAHHVIAKLRVAQFTNLELNTDVLDTLSEDELRFLVRRILGYLFGHDVVLPLVFSLLQTKNAKERTFGFFVGIIRDRLGYDYPEETLSFLRQEEQRADTSSEVKALCTAIVREIEARNAAEDALPLLKEFYPTPEKSRRFAKERHRQMAEAMEEANKKSVFRQIVTEIPLKAGRRTFQRFNGKYTDLMSLKGISHAVPIPRTEIADPMGSQRERYSFRRARKGDP